MKVMKKALAFIISVSMILSVCLITVSADEPNLVSDFTASSVTTSLTQSDLTFLDAKDSSAPFEIFGLQHNGTQYIRLDDDVAESVAPTDRTQASGNVWLHNKETSGGRVRFKTNSEYVAISANIPELNTSYGSSTYRGMQFVSFDLYVDGAFAGTFSPETKLTEAGSYEDIIDLGNSNEKNVTIYFPYLCQISDLYIGLQNTATLSHNTDTYANAAPIVYYGSSITQGGSVSSPSKTYASIIERETNYDFVDLGFWGSANGQQEIAEYIADLDMSAFILDYDHNETQTATLKTRQWNFYETVRTAHPTLPIIMVSRPNTQAENWANLRAAINENYSRAKAAGDNNVYYIDGQSFWKNVADKSTCTADGVHPTDLGASLMAEGMLPTIKYVLGLGPAPAEHSAYFEDNFDFDYYNKDWKVASNGTVEVENGQMVISNVNHLKNSDYYNWANYSYEADVTLTDSYIDPSKTGTAIAAMVVGITQANTFNDGYEFGLCYNPTTNSSYVRLFKRTAPTATPVNNIAVDYKLNDTAKLKVEIRDSVIYCYYNSDLVIKYDTGSAVTGSIGMRATVYKSLFDNIKVSEGKVLFADNFDSVDSEVWNGATSSLLSDGMLKMTNKRIYASDIQESQYTAEVDMRFDGLASGKTSGFVALGLGGVLSGDAANSYEFTIMQDTNGLYLRVYKRIATASTPVKNVQIDYTFGETAHLKVLVNGQQVYAFLDGKLITSFTAPTALNGSIVLYSSNTSASYYDNVMITKGIDEDFIFADAFTSTVNTSDWTKAADVVASGNSSINVQNVTIPAGKYLYTKSEETLEWSDYSYQADVTLVDTSSGKNPDVAAIVSGANSDRQGYEFGLCHTTDKFYVRLYDRVNKKQLATCDVDASYDTSYSMKITVFGSNIKCYFENKLVIDIDVENPVVGKIGAVTANTTMLLDSVIVTKATAPEIAQSPKFSDSFDGASLNSDWGLNKNATVSNGVLNLDSGYVYYTDNTAEANLWKNYTVEADVSLDSYPDNTNNAVVAIIAADLARTNGGYEFGLIYNTANGFGLRLLDRANTSDNTFVPFTFALGEKVHLKIELNGSKLICSANGKNYFVRETGSNLRGYFGIRSFTAVGTADNLVVTDTKTLSEKVIYDETFANYKNGDTYNNDDNIVVSYNRAKFNADSTVMLSNAIAVPNAILTTDVVLSTVSASLVAAPVGTKGKTISLYAVGSDDDKIETYIELVKKSDTLYGATLKLVINRCEVANAEMYEAELDDITVDADGKAYATENISLAVVNECVTVKVNGVLKLQKLFNNNSALATMNKQFGFGATANMITVEVDKFNLAYHNNAIYVQGDLTGNLVVNADDLTELRRLLLGIIDEVIYAGADVNRDGSITILDLVALKKLLAGRDVNPAKIEALNTAKYSGKTTTANFTDDFEDETVNESPSHWLENYDMEGNVNNWLVYSDSSSKVYGTKNTNGETATWLHVFDNNPDFRLDFKVNNASTDGKIGFITRMAPETSFVKVGYDFEASKWYITSQESDVEGSTTTWADSTSELTLNAWHTLNIIENGANITVKVDDVTVISSSNIERTSYGRVGMFTENASMFIDNFACDFSSGDIPQDGILEYSILPNTLATYLEIESIDNDNLVAVNGKAKLLSDDAGATWKNVTYTNDYKKLYNTGTYVSLLKLHDGTYMQIQTGSENLMSQTSSDLKTWTNGTNICPKAEQIDDTNGRLAIIHVNTLTEVKLSGDTYRVFCPVAFRVYNQLGERTTHITKIYYTDDKGATWNVSSTTSSDIYSNDDWSECKVIKCSDGTLRMYTTRNKTGYVSYTESIDDGVTWSGYNNITSLPCALTSFAIAEDNGTYYMLWNPGIMDNEIYSCPRSRLCLLTSTDGKNWNFAMNCEYMDPTYTVEGDSIPLYQILDPSITITDDYIYITFGRSISEDEFSHNAQRVFYIRVDKDAIQTRNWTTNNLSSVI